MPVFKLAPQPVENRHEVIADAFHPGFSETSQVLTVNIGIFRRHFPAELYLLMHRNALHDLEFKPVSRGGILYCKNAFRAPYLSRRFVVNGRDYPRHLRYLRDVFKGNGIAFPVPAKCHFHMISSLSVYQPADIPAAYFFGKTCNIPAKLSVFIPSGKHRAENSPEIVVPCV